MTLVRFYAAPWRISVPHRDDVPADAQPVVSPALDAPRRGGRRQGQCSKHTVPAWRERGQQQRGHSRSRSLNDLT
jgi:hypothetical protein